MKGSVTGDDDNVLTGNSIDVTMPELPEGVTLVVNQTVNVTDADNNVYGQLIVDADGHVTFKQTEAYSGSQHNAQGESEEATGFSGSLTVNLADGTSSSITVDVSILDDVPTISNSDMSTSVIPGDGAGNLVEGEKASFTDKADAGSMITQGAQLEGWNGVTMYAGKVTYITDTNGNTVISKNGLDINAGYTLKYSTYPNEGKPSSDWGLMVGSPEDAQAWEINVSKDGQTSEAVVFDLGGKLAYGVTIDFGAFYLGGEEDKYDHVSEKALVTFYRGDQIVGSTLVEGKSNDGKFTLDSSDVVLGGFDKVVISAVDNRTDSYINELSDFTIQGIDFITKRDDPIIVSEGTVTAESGADGFADAYTDIHAKFDLESMVGNTLSEDGTSGTITVLKDGQKQTVTLELSEGSSGESILTGTLPSGEQLFTATLDKDGNWTMEQYEQFRVPGEQGQTSSNEFGLIFKTEDADGDVVSTTVNVPLEVVDQTPGINTNISNGDDTITITGGDGVAGTIAAGDTGGVTEGQQVEANYNVCFILDTSGSMDDKVGGTGEDRNKSRLQVAVESIENFIDTSIHNGDFVGTVNLAVVTFESKYGETIHVSITRVSDGKGGYSETYTFADEKTYTSYEDFKSDFHNRLDELNANGGTNYEAGFSNAAEWFGELGNASEADGNITYFLSDGAPTYNVTVGNNSGWNTGSTTNKEDVQGAWKGYEELLNSVVDSKGETLMQVNAIGFGDLDEKAMKTLAMLDNTNKELPEGPDGVEDNVGADGWLYYDGGKYSPSGTKEVYTKYEGDPSRWDQNTYYTQLEDGSYKILQWGDGGHWNELGYYTREGWDWVWHEVTDNFYIMEEVPVVTGGNATQVNNGSGLTVAFENGFRPGELVDAGSDTITAESSTSSVIVYGDVMNTDGLRHELEHSDIDAALIATLPNYGSGSELFQWLENNADKLAGTEFEGWTHDDSVKYMMEHHEELGYETVMKTSDDGTTDFFLVDLDGNVLKMDGTETGTVLDDRSDLTGRAEGHDTITGSKAGDIIFGQEGNDTIYGGEGADTIYGGTGNDLLYGDGGDDFLFGGAGDDIIVYDGSDYLIDGGDGIDFMVSTDEGLSLDKLLTESGRDGNDGPIVNDVEVLITGKDALSLTNTEQLAKEYGITIGTDTNGDETLTLDMSKWYDKGNGSFDYIGQEDLTLETNLTPVPDTGDAEVQTQVFILNNTQG